jgi:hypothetical protein
MPFYDLKLLGDPHAAQEDGGESHSLAVREALSADVFKVNAKFLTTLRKIRDIWRAPHLLR